MTHIALLGDFVIDNKAYVGRGPDVAEQVRKLVPDEWKVTQLAIDGAVNDAAAACSPLTDYRSLASQQRRFARGALMRMGRLNSA